MDESELKELTLRFQESIRQSNAEEFIKQNPKSILALRLSLGLSQKDFIRKVKNKISQVALIKHEKGRSSRINSVLLKEVVKLVPNFIDINLVIENHKKFDSMKKGIHMTTERARKLNELWQKKTKRSQRQDWGKKGALKTNSSQRLTEQEKKVKEILDRMNLEYKIHHQIKTKSVDMNIDFVLFNKNKPICFIEVSERKHDLQILCQAYAYRCRILKENYPWSRAGIVINDVPFSAKKIIEKEFDFMLNTNSIHNLSEFLQF